jgi:hypothetical protein
MVDHPKELRPYLRRGTLSVFNRNFQDDLRQAVRAVWIGSLASVK